MLHTEERVRANIRTREGRRVYFLPKEDTLTPGARDYLNRERIPILDARDEPMEQYRLPCGAVLRQKPEHMTHLQGNILVFKDHPRIRFRGAMDTVQAEVLLCQFSAKPQLQKDLQEILDLARKIIRCEVLEEPLEAEKLCGLTQAELRSHSHRPQEYYGQGHFMPSSEDGMELLMLNRLRCAVREAECLAVTAFADGEGNLRRGDIIQAMNRMSSMVYILMIRQKKH
jgi:ethanolamine utilization cobalamin adenosyltransferase